MNKNYLICFLALALTFLSCSKEPATNEGANMIIKTVDLDKYSAEKPEKPTNLLFIHHSCGGQWLADKGDDKGENCIYVSNPNGGGLRRMLEGNNYIVHEASYGSIIGEKTDVCDWHAKFKDLMQQILICRKQNENLPDGMKNQIVMFKSCFPNSWIDSVGTEPGNPDTCVRTTANYKAAYNSLLEYFEKQPETLFIVVTAPPLVQPDQTSIKNRIKNIIGRQDTVQKVGSRTRDFNNWLKDLDNGWLKDYKLNNVVVFDLYDVLTGHGRSNWLLYPTGGGTDSHPSSEGNSLAAEEFIPFLNRAVSRMVNQK